MKDYTSVSCEFTYTRKTKSAEVRTTLKADLYLAADTQMGAWTEFYANLRKILSALRKAIKENSEVSLEFNRYSYIDGYICHERMATFNGFAGRIADEGGVYLSDSDGNTGSDFWLDSGTDMADSIREFADNSYYWSAERRKV